MKHLALLTTLLALGITVLSTAEAQLNPEPNAQPAGNVALPTPKMGGGHGAGVHRGGPAGPGIPGMPVDPALAGAAINEPLAQPPASLKSRKSKTATEKMKSKKSAALETKEKKTKKQ